MRKGSIGLSSGMEGGVLASMSRKMLTKQTMFQQVIDGRDHGGTVLAPPTYGDVVLLDVPSGGVILTKGAFLACESSVELTLYTSGVTSGAWLTAKGIFLTRQLGMAL